jgi:CheY-like chemotaxis protein
MSFKPKILILETEEHTREFVVTALERMGARAHGCASGQAGIQLLEREKFDGAFLDWDNLDLPGEELVRRIRRSVFNGQIPVTMFTEATDTRVIAEAFKSGVTLFLSKPFGPLELERLLNASRGTMYEERRRYRRVLLSVPVICEWGRRRGFKRVTGRTVNISSGGMLMRLHPQPAQGAAISSELILPRRKLPLKLACTVVRAAPNRQVAVQFAHLSVTQRDQLEDYIGSPENKLVSSGWIKA